MLKKLTLLFCAVVLMLLAACKQETTNTENSASTPSNVQSTTSGIELEEDVFDDSDISGNSSANTSTNTSSNTSSGNDTNSENESTDDTSSDPASGGNPDQETSSENQGAEVGDDGTVKLPIDHFN